MMRKVLIQILQRFEQDDFASTRTLPIYASVWATMYDKSMTESFGEGRNISEITHEFLTRFIHGVENDMIIKLEGNYYRITNIINIEMKNKELKLMTRQDTAEIYSR